MGLDLFNVVPYARMEANKSCLIKRYNSLYKSVEENDIDKIYQSTSELLYWIINTNDLLYKTFKKEYKKKLKEEHIEEMLFGLRFAFNANKHNMIIFGMSKKNNREIGPLSFTEWVWADFSTYNPSPQEEKAYTAYINRLEDELIIGTLNITKTFLIEQINNLKR